MDAILYSGSITTIGRPCGIRYTWHWSHYYFICHPAISDESITHVGMGENVLLFGRVGGLSNLCSGNAKVCTKVYNSVVILSGN